MVHKQQFKTKVDFYWKQTLRKIDGKRRRVWIKKEAVFKGNKGRIVYRIKMIKVKNNGS